MKKIYKLGVHTFYRPRAWGDGSDEPSLGRSQGDREEKLAKAEERWGPVSHSLEWLRFPDGQAYARQNARQ